MAIGEIQYSYRTVIVLLLKVFTRLKYFDRSTVSLFHYSIVQCSVLYNISNILILLYSSTTVVQHQMSITVSISLPQFTFSSFSFFFFVTNTIDRGGSTRGRGTKLNTSLLELDAATIRDPLCHKQ